ncbi:hypothetical protein [Brachybacterium sp. UMB0905]|uniref:hypothetical protein n=1 Tax=Brachybacterium sp. UMB0905 TaxID=2069310 RepID=UPI000C803D72|nr:hypothetical protein [Brachybacterium sp. UMB0905]PMC74313.1 hypothetical protein CJ197_14135 [Brachybacterium sp. UMB0905]
MINQIRADLFALRHGATVWLCLGASALAAALYTWLQHALAAGQLPTSAASSVQGLSDVLLISLLGPLLYGVIIAQPFTTRTVHTALLAAGRGAFIGAKTVLAPLVIAALMLPYGVAVVVGRMVGTDFVPAVPSTIPLLLAAPEELTFARAAGVLGLSLVTGVVMAAKLAVCLPLAVWLRRPLVVMAIGFVWGFLGDLVGGKLAEVEGLDALVALTPYHPERVPLPETSAGDLLVTMGVCVGFIALMGLLAWILFRRADVK